MATTRETIWKWGTEYSGAGTAEFKLDLADLTGKAQGATDAFDKQGKKLIELELSKRRVLHATQSLGMGLAMTASQGLTATSAFQGGAVAVGTFAHLLGGFGTILGPAALLLGGLAEGLFKFGEHSEAAEEKLQKLSARIEVFKSASEILREERSKDSLVEAKMLDLAQKQLKVEQERAKFSDEAKALRKDIAESKKKEADLDEQVRVRSGQLIILVQEQARTHTALGHAIAQESANVAKLNAEFEKQKKSTTDLQGSLKALTHASELAGDVEVGLGEKIDEEMLKQIGAFYRFIHEREKGETDHLKRSLEAWKRDSDEKMKLLDAYPAEHLKILAEIRAGEKTDFDLRRDQVAKELAARIEALEKYKKAGINVEQDLLALRGKAAQETIKIDQEEAKAKVQVASITATQIASVIGSLAQYEEATGKKTFGDLKALKEAEVVVNTAAAIMSALGTSGNIYAGVALAASAAIAGALQIATIEAAQPGSSTIAAPTLSTGTVGTAPGTAPSPGGNITGPASTSTSAPGVMNVQIILENLNVNVLDPSAISDATYRAIARRVLEGISFDIHQRGGTF